MIARRPQIALFATALTMQSFVMIAPRVMEASEMGVPAGSNIAELKTLSNPLWATSLDQLSSTRQRPLFSPTRRPRPAVVIGPVAAAPIVVPLPPERPQLSLVGTVVGEQDGIGVFIEKSTQKMFRLKIGEAREGWILRSIQSRTVSLEKAGRSAVIEMPSVSLPQTAASPTRVLKQ